MANWAGAPGAASVLCELTWGKEKFAAIRRLSVSRRPLRLDFDRSLFRGVYSGESCSTSSPRLPSLTLA